MPGRHEVGCATAEPRVVEDLEVGREERRLPVDADRHRAVREAPDGLGRHVEGALEEAHVELGVRRPVAPGALARPGRRTAEGGDGAEGTTDDDRAPGEGDLARSATRSSRPPLADFVDELGLPHARGDDGAEHAEELDVVILERAGAPLDGERAEGAGLAPDGHGQEDGEALLAEPRRKMLVPPVPGGRDARDGARIPTASPVIPSPTLRRTPPMAFENPTLPRISELALGTPDEVERADVRREYACDAARRLSRSVPSGIGLAAKATKSRTASRRRLPGSWTRERAAGRRPALVDPVLSSLGSKAHRREDRAPFQTVRAGISTSLPPIGLRDVPAQHHRRPVLTFAQRDAQLFEEALDAVLLHLDERQCIDARRALVGSYPPPRLQQDVTPADVVVQRVEAPSRRPLGRGPQSSLQLSHFVARPTAGGVVRSALGGHSLALTCFADMTTAGTLPSGRVVRRDPRRYLGPLGLPLRSGRLRLRLIRRAWPRRGPRRRVSRVPHSSLHACCAPYPAGTDGALRNMRRRGGLRREMTGSAPGLFLCRGCKLHFMLRPACLLPAARLSPPDGLLTPRSVARVSPGRLGPATRCSDRLPGRGLSPTWRGRKKDGPVAASRGVSFRLLHGAPSQASIATPTRGGCAAMRVPEGGAQS